MLTLIIIIVVLALTVFGTVKLIDKSTNRSLKIGLSVVLWAISIVFTYLIYQSIQAPIEFDKLKEKRKQRAYVFRACLEQLNLPG